MEGSGAGHVRVGAKAESNLWGRLEERLERLRLVWEENEKWTNVTGIAERQGEHYSLDVSDELVWLVRAIEKAPYLLAVAGGYMLAGDANASGERSPAHRRKALAALVGRLGHP